jgi:hypothetical protein
MTPAPHGVLAPILGLLQRLLAGREPLLVSSALAHGPLDALAATLPGTSHLRFRPWHDADFDELAPADHQDDAGVATQVVLGAEDLDLALRRSPLIRVAEGGPAVSRRKLRRLDGLLGPVAPRAGPLHVLYVGEAGTRALAVLEGAGNLLATQQPAVLLPLDGGAAAAAAAALLRRAGHVLLDPQLRPLPQTGIPPATWALALAGTVAGAVEVHAGAVAPVPAWTIAIDEPLTRRGFYPVEGAAPATWSWIGPRPRAALLLPCWRGSLRRISLQMRAVAPGIDIADAVAVVDGVPAVARVAAAELEVEMPHAAAPRAFQRLDLGFLRSTRVERERRLVVAALASVRLHFAAE